MASDLISREGSIIALRRLAYQEIRGRAFVPIDAVERTLNRQRESVDAVEVVRCRDCKFGQKPTVCLRLGTVVKPNDFCSRGVKKDVVD